MKFYPAFKFAAISFNELLRHLKDGTSPILAFSLNITVFIFELLALEQFSDK